MTLQQLRHFLAVVEHGSFHRAADALHISQQALSASIGKLEQSLGTALFDRGPNGVVTAPSGARLIQRAKLICSEALRAEQEIRESEDANVGTVRIGVGAFFAERLVPVFLASYLKHHPNLNMSILGAASRELFVALTHGEIDFSLSTPSPGLEIPYELEHEVLFTIPAAVHMRSGHPLAPARRLDLAQLAECSWVVAPAHMDGLAAAFSSVSLPPPRRLIKTDSLAVLRYFVTESDSVMLGLDPPPELSLFLPGTVVAHKVPDLGVSMQAVLVWRRSSTLLPSAGRLMEHIRDAYRALGRNNS
jgi:DNA-binding transcriptional LysR family regulator